MKPRTLTACGACILIEDDSGFDWLVWCAKPYRHDGEHHTVAGEVFDDAAYEDSEAHP